MSEPNYTEKRIPLLADFTVKDAAELADCMEAVRVLSDAVIFMTEEPVADGDEDLTPWDRHERGENEDLAGSVTCVVQRTTSRSHFGVMYVIRVPNNDICMRFVEVPTDLVVDVVGARFRIGKFRYGIMIGSSGG